jgi:hypothetical protein
LRKLLRTIVIVGATVFVANLLLSKFFFKSDLDQEPELTDFIESIFEFSSSKPFYFKVDNSLFYSEEGILDYSLEPILTGQIEEAYISPNGKYALIYNDNKLTLIDNFGKVLVKVEDCTDLIAVEENKRSGRFNSSEVQWSKSSDFFLIAQYRIWDKNYSNKNKSSIYKYSIADNSFKTFIDLDEELQGDFVLSRNEKYLYYEFATSKGDLAFKRIELANGKIISEHHQDDSLKLTNFCAGSVFINYNKFKYNFQGNSFDLKSIITTARTSDIGLYYKDSDTTVRLLSGTSGYGAFKGNRFDYFNNGFYLPGNKYFIANISAKNFSGQLVIDTKEFRIMKLTKNTEFYFNVNSIDCDDFVFRYRIEPNVKFAISVGLEIEGRK